jgi:hypothetical protein
MTTFVANRTKSVGTMSHENGGPARVRVNKALFAGARAGQPK